MADTEMTLLPSEAELLRDNLADALADIRSIRHELLRGSATALGPDVAVVPKGGPGRT
ncbi:hypothetical protein AB0O76_01725 [Streptomyces sp. NPDC086554]|uniref:hypothetical protein n=1 Tax=Streptomyces sp. NPDC086554 TaxID=3154864 RepID=UPI0034347F87